MSDSAAPDDTALDLWRRLVNLQLPPRRQPRRGTASTPHVPVVFVAQERGLSRNTLGRGKILKLRHHLSHFRIQPGVTEASTAKEDSKVLTQIEYAAQFAFEQLETILEGNAKSLADIRRRQGESAVRVGPAQDHAVLLRHVVQAALPLLEIEEDGGQFTFEKTPLPLERREVRLDNGAHAIVR